MIGPYFDDLSKKYEANKGVRFLKVDVDELEEVLKLRKSRLPLWNLI